MPIHADEKGWNAIRYFKKQILEKLLSKVHDHYLEIIEKREEEGWTRTSTPRIKETIEECIRGLDEDKSLRKVLDIFLVIYDSDNAYTNFFNEFVEKCNNKELVLEKGNMYMSYEKGSDKWKEREWREQKNMDDEELDNIMK